MFPPSDKELPGQIIDSNLKTLGMTWKQFEDIIATI
jgi:hypothetical protein